mgnify:CR=1 FL=1
MFDNIRIVNQDKMKQSITFLLLLFFSVTFGQDPAKSVSSEIMESIKSDVWVPFMESYDELDSQKIKTIHSQDIVRVLVHQNQVETGSTYLDNFAGFIESVKDKGNRIGISFAILTTAVDHIGTIAYQTGYYRFRSYGNGAKNPIFQGYGYFHVGLRKENGTWKIWLDSDNHTDITDEDFNNCEIIYEL